jgi:hypothetical protein
MVSVPRPGLERCSWLLGLAPAMAKGEDRIAPSGEDRAIRHRAAGSGQAFLLHHSIGCFPIYRVACGDCRSSGSERCVLPRDRVRSFPIRRLACEICRPGGSRRTVLLHDRVPLTPDLPSGFLELANWGAGTRYAHELPPDREQLSLPLYIQAFPVELGAGSPHRFDKARREAENVPAFAIADAEDQPQ